MKKIEESIKEAFIQAAEVVGISSPVVHLEHPEVFSHGDYATNIALMHAKDQRISPRVLADKIVQEYKKIAPLCVAQIEVAGPGFINIKLKDEVFREAIVGIDADFGKGTHDKGKRIMVEYTDPNPFKIFHIGHLMANAVGESLSRLVQFSGAHVIRANYYGDVGLHVAKTIWGILQNKEKFPSEKDELVSRVAFLGEMYVLGTDKYESDESAKTEIVEINKKIFEKTDTEINFYYDLGRAWSLESFEIMYEKLGTKFDYYFPESEVASQGVEIVKKFLAHGVFEKSDGAVIFPGEKHGVHTRVFINSQGLPTYEAKEVGLTNKKFTVEPDLAESIVVTAHEQTDYFNVLLKALSIMYPERTSKMIHKSHGVLRFASGKMSSRKGNIISADALISDMEDAIAEKMKGRDFTPEEFKNIGSQIAIGALKYTILRQAIGTDVIYDKEKSISFEGDSGPYLQYACVRAQNVLNKAVSEGIQLSDLSNHVDYSEDVTVFEKLLVRFPEIVERARLEYSPNYIVTYLIELASAFNAYYAKNKIVDTSNSSSIYRVALTQAFVHVISNGLWILGIKVPQRM